MKTWGGTDAREVRYGAAVEAGQEAALSWMGPGQHRVRVCQHTSIRVHQQVAQRHGSPKLLGGAAAGCGRTVSGNGRQQGRLWPWNPWSASLCRVLQCANKVARDDLYAGMRSEGCGCAWLDE